MNCRLTSQSRRLIAVVEMGQQRGRLLGFPTANLYPDDRAERERGVYSALARTADGQWWPAAVNIGTRPTFVDGTAVSVEVHLIGFDGDLYGSMLTVHFLDRLREETKFDSIDALIAQLRTDVLRAAESASAARARGDVEADPVHGTELA